jgi:NMD protein affecting ribosome stability and mRNA decay
MILVSQTKNEVQIMDPKNYRLFDIKKPKNINFKSNTLEIIKFRDKIFLLPEKNITDI